MRLLACLSVLTLFALPLQAGGVNAAQIDARARWVAHLDLETLHQTQLYKAVLDADEKHEIELGLSELFVTEGIDLFRDVHGATIYGTGLDEDGTVALFQTTSAIEPALARWREKLAAKPIDVAGHACVAWNSDEDPGFSYLLAEPESTTRLLVVARTAETLGRAIGVLEAKTPSLAREAVPGLVVTTRPGTFAFATATGIFDQIPGVAGEGPQSAIARLAQGLRVELGEREGRLFFDCELRTKADEDATRMHQILQGLLALASFATEEPDVGATIGRWIKALDIARVGPSVRLRFEYDLVTLIREARALEAIEKEKAAEKRDEKKSKEPK